jgi:hypothetical protein
MQLTVRVPDEVGEKIEALSKRLCLKKSDVVHLAIQQFADDNSGGDEGTPFQRVRYLVGIGESGISDLGRRHRDHLVNKVRGRPWAPAWTWLSCATCGCAQIGPGLPNRIS